MVTTYAYGFEGADPNAKHGDLVGTTYTNDPAGAPAVTLVYDRLGRLQTATQNGFTNTLAYNYASQLLSESYSGGPLGGVVVENQYDIYLRRTTKQVRLTTGSPLAAVAYGYSQTSGWLDTVSSGNYAAGYSYVANSPLVSQINFKQGSVVKMTTAKAYDPVNRLTSIQSAVAGANQLPQAFGYQYNAASQRQRVTLADGSCWRYEYDSLGQVKSSKKYWADGTPVAGQQFEYGHDDIGNRTDTKAGGDPSGAGLRPASYSANSLNQYSSRTNSGAVDVLGQALVSATVTVNGNATYRKNDYFQHALSVANSGGPVAQSITVEATLNGTNATSGTRYLLVPQAQEAFQYDADGNLTSDSLWSYTWDAENRLLAQEMSTSLPASARQKLEFTYDWQGRRISKKVYNWDAGSNGYPASTTNQTRFVYDGWNLVAELNSDLSLKTSYAWGLDLSGSIQGAGGVGGLLFAVYYSPSTEVYFPAYDANGNIMALCKGSDATWASQYEYGPFGELIRMTGSMAKANPFRFSTKFQDEETGLVYYGFRFYNPSLARWLSRDPIGERGGLNVYSLGPNSPANGFDDLGGGWLWTSTPTGWSSDGYGNMFAPPLPNYPQPRSPGGAASNDEQDEIDAQIDALSGRNEQVFQFCHNTANIGYEALELLPPGQAWQFVTGTNLRDEKVGLGQRALAGAGPTLRIVAKGTVCCAAVCVVVKVKRANLPAWKKVAVAMEHIASGHMAGGNRVSSY